LLFVALVLSRSLFRPERKAFLILGLWVVGVFFLHENNPNGLWLVSFPLWYRIDGNRAFDVTSFVAASVAALVLERLIRWILPPLVGSKDSLLRRLRAVKADRRKSVAVSALTILLAGQLLANGLMVYGSRPLSPVTADDIVAFDWIQGHTPSTTTFFVNWADAGSWIPQFANRRVVMPFGVVTNYALLNDYYRAVDHFASNASNLSSIRFMEGTGATWVYVSSARIYGRQGFDSVKISASGLFDVVYHRNSVWIFTLNQSRVPVGAANWPMATGSAVSAVLQPWRLEKGP
jgi:hypothetical protein